MHEYQHQHPETPGEAERRDKLDGVYGVTNKVTAMVQVALERAIGRFANEPVLQDFSDDELAEAIVTGLRQAVEGVPKPNIIERISAVRKRHGQ